MMKITKRKLQQMIKEELEIILSEDIGRMAGFNRVSRLGDEDETKKAESLEPMQYTFANIYEEYPTLIVKDKMGMAYLSRATERDPEKNETIILNTLMPMGYKSVGIIGPNAHLRTQ